MKRLAGYSIEKEEIDRILSREDEILPSSGFAVSVMNAVRREAAAPPPIRFPWKRALPGIVVAGSALLLILIAGVVDIVRAWKASGPQLSASTPFAMPSLFDGGIESATIWIILALLMALVSVKVTMGLASSRA